MAEGVEHAHQADLLRDKRVGYAQGGVRTRDARRGAVTQLKAGAGDTRGAIT